MKMYSQRVIELDKFSDYDIDHIYPRSKTGDDSMVNKVLVYKPVNNFEKKDIYPISSDIQERMKETWLFWKQKKFIDEEKYHRLIRNYELSEEELTGFINRQLVETSQSTKAFTQVLKQLMPQETEIVYSKAKNVSRFRNDRLKMVKVREMNDLHHAITERLYDVAMNEVYYEKTLKLLGDVEKYLYELEWEVDFNVEISLENFHSIIKAGVTGIDVPESLYEKIIEYIKLSSRLLKTKVIILIGVQGYFTQDEWEQIEKVAIYEEVSLLCLENKKWMMSKQNEVIIDIDNCRVV